MMACDRRATTSSRACKSVAALATVLVTAALPVSAQVIDSVDRALLEEWRMARGNQINFCVFEDSTAIEFDRAIAEGIAERLLVNYEVQTLPSGFGVDGEYLEAELYTALVNECEIIMGVRVATDVYPDDFTVVRPYVNYEYMLVTDNAEYDELEDVPDGSRIGTQLATLGDFYFARYIATRPAGEGWTRLPYGDVNLMLDRLLDGTIEAMLIFAPVYDNLAETRQEDTSDLKRLPLTGELAGTSNIGGLMLSRNNFLRIEIDQAIEDMIADGTVQTLLEETGLDDVPASPGEI